MVPCKALSVHGSNSSLVRSLLPAGVSAAILCGLATLVEHLEQCTTVAGCSFYWAFSVLIFGILHRELGFLHETKRAEAWDNLYVLLQKRIYRARGMDLRPVAREQLDLYGHPRPSALPAFEQSSVLLLYGDRPEYFEQPDVAPFMLQLRCYAEARGMRFAVNARGLPVLRTHLARLDVSIAGEYYVASAEEEPETSRLVEALVQELFNLRRLERAVELPRWESSVSLHYGQPLHFGRIWAIEEQLNAVEPGALVIYFDVDVTIRPDSWHKGLVERLLEQRVGGKEAAHVFVADTWIGTECVNSGFVAVRNTRVGRLFLELWRQKLWWAASWDQAALAETILELVGAEVWKLSAGQRLYDSHCLPLLFPVVDGTYSFTRYCDCWQGALEKLVGPYRRRQSRLVSFVDPERTEVNFIPNNLFYDHNYQLDRMRLVGHDGMEPLRPMVIHWAGLGRMRLELLTSFLRDTFNLSIDSCPKGPHWALDTLAARPELTHRKSFGTRARHIRCCEKLQKHEDKSAWPWNEEDHVWRAVVHWWGCSEWCSVTAEDCEELLGQPLHYTW